MYAVARPDELEAGLGLSPAAAPLIGAIIVFAANAEFRLERAIWRLQGHVPRGVKHATDAMQISQLVDMFEAEGAKLPTDPQRQMVSDWCAAARVAFEFRHSIAHGAAFRRQSSMHIERNRSWEGEMRKRPPSTLGGTQNALENIRLTFAVLLRVINSVSNQKRTLREVASPERLQALATAKVVMREMAATQASWFGGT